MATTGEPPQDLEPAIADVFRGSLEEFVARRDALAKQLRAGGRRDEAAAVKRLRRPTRQVWALDAAVLADDEPVERLAAAVTDMVAAQSGRGDVRAASHELRDAVRDLAVAAAREAADQGHPVDQAALIPAVLAVVADGDAFDALRRGRLVEIPETGGFDVLAAGPAVAPVARPPRRRPSRTAGEPEAPAGPEAEAPAPAGRATERAVAAARRAVDDAEATLATARERAERANAAVSEGEARADAAEERLRRAEEEARAAREDLRRAHQESRGADRGLREAERAAARARATLDDLTR